MDNFLITLAEFFLQVLSLIVALSTLGLGLAEFVLKLIAKENPRSSDKEEPR